MLLQFKSCIDLITRFVGKFKSRKRISANYLCLLIGGGPHWQLHLYFLLQQIFQKLVKKNLVKIGINKFCFEEKTFEFFPFPGFLNYQLLNSQGK